MSAIFIQGPWAVVRASTDDPDTAEYSVLDKAFETKNQAETFIRKNFTKEEARRLFPWDVRKIQSPKYKIDKTFKNMEEARNFAARIISGPKGKN